MQDRDAFGDAAGCRGISILPAAPVQFSALAVQRLDCPGAPREPRTPAWGLAGATGAGPKLAMMHSGVLHYPGHPHTSGGCREVICTPQRQQCLVRSGMIRLLGDATQQGAQVPGNRLPRGLAAPSKATRTPCTAVSGMTDTLGGESLHSSRSHRSHRD